ncbi:MAG: hypothetical protein JWM11_5353, partial [Planctomycetaceae bacterium]|nr:hypothetical protein [Planctomycetaceae bacterium]
MLTRSICCLLFSFAFVGLTEAQDKPAVPPYFEQKVADSNPLRTAQAKELDAYIKVLKQSDTQLRAVLIPDYSSPQAYEKSIKPYRKKFCESIGYP